MIKNKFALNIWKGQQKEKTKHQLNEMYNKLTVDEHKILDYAIEHNLLLKDAIVEYGKESK